MGGHARCAALASGHEFDADPGDGDAWITYDAGFHVDVATGLGWGGTCAIADPGCLATNCGQQSPACDSCTGGQGPNAGQYCKVDVRICSHDHTSSPCSDCGDAGGISWIYGTSNGNFLPFDSAFGIPTACVSVVPNGVPTNDGG